MRDIAKPDDYQTAKRPSEVVGVNLRIIRRKMDLTIENAAKIACVHRSTWGRWETGDTAIDVDELYRVARAIGCDVRELLPSSMEF